MWGYLAVAGAAALVTGLVTPLVVRGVRRMGAVEVPADPRRSHTDPVPTLGGLAMVVGFLVAVGLAAVLTPLQPVFEQTSEPVGIVIGVALIALLGVVDDLRDLPPSVKLAGQIVAASAPVLFGVQIVYAWVPGLEVVSLGPDLGFVLTVAAIVAMVNAVNLIDGLDGLAAGVVAIGATAFFAFAVVSQTRGITETVPTSAPLMAAVLVGMCVGFLVHNFHPASIFMGDTGSMTLGLLLGASGVAYVGRSTAPGYADFYASIPLLIPVLVLAVPFLDVAFAVVRRTSRRQPITVADKGHLHHLLIAFGHSHRRAVLVLYYWSALVAGSAVALSLARARELAPWLLVGAAVGVTATVIGITSGDVGAPRRTPPADDDADEPTPLRRTG